MNHGDIAPTFHVRRNDVDCYRVVLAQKFQGAVRKNHAKAPSGVGWALLEQLDLVAGMPAFPHRGEIEPARTTANHGNAHWPMLHGAPSGRATSKVSSSFAPYSKLFLHDPIGKRKEHACAVHGLVHDGVPTRRNKNSFWYRASDLSPIRVRPRPSVTRRQKDSRVGRATNARSPPSCFPAHPTGRCFIGACRGDCQIAPGSSC